MKYKENKERVEGRIYQFDLSLRTVQNEDSKNFGTEFISGTIEVAVDEEILNVIPVHFTYVVEQTKSGKKNATFSTLKKIIDEGKTIVADGKDVATKVRINTALGLNEFYTQNDELVSVKINEGGFVTIVNTLAPVEERNTFEADIVITGITMKDTEEGQPPVALVRGAIFDFKGNLLPMEFVLRNPQGINYLEEKGVSNSNPLYTKINNGRINCQTIETKVTEETAFGEPAVKTYTKRVKEWEILSTLAQEYDFGAEDVLTSEELTKLMQDREIMLAELKERNKKYQAQKATNNAPQAQPQKTVAKQGTFNF